MWNTIASSPEDRLVMTKIDDGDGFRNVQPMKRSQRLWFSGDMYVYYQPTHWRELTEVERLRLKNQAEKRAIDALERANQELGI